MPNHPLDRALKEIVKDLLSHRASLQASVFRDGRAYCDVLHTALSFEEGQKQAGALRKACLPALE